MKLQRGTRGQYKAATAEAAGIQLTIETSDVKQTLFFENDAEQIVTGLAILKQVSALDLAKSKAVTDFCRLILASQ